MRRELDDRGTAAMALGVAAMAALYAPLGGSLAEKILRVAVGVPLVLALPGHAILLALRPRWPQRGGASDGSVPRVERWAWTVALSVAVAVLGAFLLDRVPGGLSRTNWLILLGATTVLAGAVVAGRPFFSRPRPVLVLAVNGAANGSVNGSVNGVGGPRLRVRSRRRTTAAFGCAAGIAAAAVWLGVSSAAAVPEPGFAQLWLVPNATANGSAAATGPTRNVVKIGVHSFEERDQQFRLDLRADGAVVQTWTFPLHPGDEWRETVDLQPGRTVVAELYRGTEPGPYRRVWRRAG